MFVCVFFFVLLFSSNYAFPSRIVNGTDAKLGELPYIVSLQDEIGHICGASILDATHVLTAAHCVIGGDNIQMYIQYGVIDLRTNKNKIPVSKKVYHEEYMADAGFANDVAVLTLSGPIQFSQYTQPATLPEQDEPIPANKLSVLAGWGYEMSDGSVQDILQLVNLKVYSDNKCEAGHPGQTNRKYHVCSGVDEGGKGQCSGDSGGPLYANEKQIGIVSWSVKPCGNPGYPGVFARVSSYVDWIREQITD